MPYHFLASSRGDDLSNFRTTMSSLLKAVLLSIWSIASNKSYANHFLASSRIGTMLYALPFSNHHFLPIHKGAMLSNLKSHEKHHSDRPRLLDSKEGSALHLDKFKKYTPAPPFSWPAQEGRSLEFSNDHVFSTHKAVMLPIWSIASNKSCANHFLASSNTWGRCSMLCLLRTTISYLFTRGRCCRI